MSVVDPCRVLTAGQLLEMDIPATPGEGDPAGVGNNNSPSCIWLSPSDVDFVKPTESVFVQAVTYLGVDDVFKRATEEKYWTTVQGFRALQRENSTGLDDLAYQVWVDVNNGQSLNVAYSIHGWKGTEEAGKDEARDKATRAANMAVATLLVD